MLNLPASISIAFILVTFFSVYIFYKASGGNRMVLYTLLTWITLQGALGYAGFYTNTKGFPPRFMLTVVPAVASILILFFTTKGRAFFDGLNLRTLTLLHVVRVPVELVLYALFAHKAIPQIMTFEGNNFDVLSGLTAPIVWYITRNNKHNKLLLAWNIACLCLLINIVVIAVLSAPFTFQQIAFDQPNVAVLYFPFVWLPACVVPLVLVSHLAAIRQLSVKK